LYELNVAYGRDVAGK